MVEEGMTVSERAKWLVVVAGGGGGCSSKCWVGDSRPHIIYSLDVVKA